MTPARRVRVWAFRSASCGPNICEGVSGIHFHSLCEQDFEPLKRTWESLKPKIAPYFGQLKWLNFGGGHHITRADYQRDDLVDFIKSVRAETGLEIYLEPGEAIALDAGILVGELLDVFDNGMPVGITDISATCHMPDVIEAPYRPAMLGEARRRPRHPPRRPLLPRRRHHRRLPPARARRTRRTLRFSRSSALFDGQDQHLQRRAFALDLAVEQRH